MTKDKLTYEELENFVDCGVDILFHQKPINDRLKNHKQLLMDISNSSFDYLDNEDNHKKEEKMTIKGLRELRFRRNILFLLFRDEKLQAEFTKKIMLDNYNNENYDYDNMELENISEELLQEIVDKYNEIEGRNI